MAEKKKKVLNIALAGQPNVGKSVIFNQLTGMNQVVGNWPGKTVQKAEGFSLFGNYKFNIIDLPGIYSLTTYSLEEIVTREYIVEQEPDYIVNVLDANQLERNLYLSLQLFLLDRPVIMVLNQYDILRERGYEIDAEKLEKELGVPVLKSVAVHNRGVHEILEKIIEIEETGKKLKPLQIQFGKEIEVVMDELTNSIKKAPFESQEPLRFFVQKVLENDRNCVEQLEVCYDQQEDVGEDLVREIRNKREHLEDYHGHEISEIFNGEYYQKSSKIVDQVQVLEKQTKKNKIQTFFDHLTVHSVWGYVFLALVLLGSYLFVFWLGNLTSTALDSVYGSWTESVLTNWNEGSWKYRILWKSIMGGFIAGVGGVLPYVIPFYIIIEILQDVGYLPRAAYLMDRFMHSIGLHGKAIIPMLLGFGCNVPAISATMIMETEKEKKRAIVAASFVPCSAVTTIVLGLVAKYMGIGYALLLYLINFIVILGVGKVMKKLDPEEDIDLIIEFHEFRKPNVKVILKQAWHRSKEFVYRALPLIVILGVLLEVLMEYNLLNPLNTIMKPLTVGFLGLPIGVSVYLFYGILRKELNLVLLQLYVASLGLTMTQFMTPQQMIVFTLVTMLYVPCLATIVMIKHHEGTKFATKVFFLLLAVGILVAGAVRWIWELVIFLS